MLFIDTVNWGWNWKYIGRVDKENVTEVKFRSLFRSLQEGVEQVALENENWISKSLEGGKCSSEKKKKSLTVEQIYGRMILHTKGVIVVVQND